MKKQGLFFILSAMVFLTGCTCCSYQFKFFPPYDYNQKPLDQPAYKQANPHNDSFPVYKWQLVPLLQWQKIDYEELEKIKPESVSQVGRKIEQIYLQSNPKQREIEKEITAKFFDCLKNQEKKFQAQKIKLKTSGIELTILFDREKDSVKIKTKMLAKEETGKWQIYQLTPLVLSQYSSLSDDQIKTAIEVLVKEAITFLIIK